MCHLSKLSLSEIFAFASTGDFEVHVEGGINTGTGRIRVTLIEKETPWLASTS